MGVRIQCLCIDARDLRPEDDVLRPLTAEELAGG